MSSNSTKIALVTGANKGLGFEIARQLAKQGIKVIIGARDAAKGQAAAEKLKSQSLDVEFHLLNVTDSESISETINWIEEKFGVLHILVNNAAINLEFPGETSILEVSPETIAKSFQTNFYAPLLLIQMVIPLMRKANYGRIVNMSSTLGSLGDASNSNSVFAPVQTPAYRISKTGLNSLTVLFAKELKGTNILINSACPGWVKTDMGTDAAPLTIEEGVDTPVWLATLPDDGFNGGFFNERQLSPW